MIFVTTGTTEHPFDRLVRAARELGSDEELVVQYGSSTERPGEHGVWQAFMDFGEMERHMCDARIVVAHAGVGSILLAHRCGKRPVVVPRVGNLVEAVDEHQLELGRRLHARGEVTLVEDEADLASVLAWADGDLVRDDGAPVNAALVNELRATLNRLTGVA